MRARSGQRDHLRVHPGSLQNLFAVIDVAMARHGNVVVTGIMQAGIPFLVVSNPHRARTLLQRLDIFGRIVMIVKINNRHQLVAFLER